MRLCQIVRPRGLRPALALSAFQPPGQRICTLARFNLGVGLFLLRIGFVRSDQPESLEREGYQNTVDYRVPKIAGQTWQRSICDEFVRRHKEAAGRQSTKIGKSPSGSLSFSGVAT